MVVSWMETKRGNYNTKLDVQLGSLESKLTQLLALHQAVRNETLLLRQQLASASDQDKQLQEQNRHLREQNQSLQEQNRQLTDRMAEASRRLEVLLTKLPEVE